MTLSGKTLTAICFHTVILMEMINNILSEGSTTSEPDAACRQGWLMWPEGKTCYRKFELPSKLSDQNKMVYDVAANGCWNQFSQIVAITSSSKNKFIAGNSELIIGPMFGYVLIGLRKADTGEWTWMTGESVDYTNWRSSTIVPEHNCAIIVSDGTWVTQPCRDIQHMQIQYVCEYSLLEQGRTRYDIKKKALSTSSYDSIIPISTDPIQFTSGAVPNLQSDYLDLNFIDGVDTVTDKLNQHTSNQDFALSVAIPASICTVLLFVAIIVVYKCRSRKRRKRNTGENMPQKVELELSDILLSMLDEYKQLRLRNLLIPTDAVEIKEQQGQGAFGIVYKGCYTLDNHSANTQMVAIKTLKDKCIGSQIAGLVEEAFIMAEFNHIHVMSIIGVCIRPDDGVPMVLMPFMDNGDLNTYLRTFIFSKLEEKPGERQLLVHCLEIAKGMEYLAQQKFVHRDLAARNCMVDSNLVVKVADFGLTRDIYTSSYYQQDQQKFLPIKWMALESLQYRRFSCETDIWSFGVTMWEVMALGMVPYPDLDNADVHRHVRAGTRLDNPDNCPRNMYLLMSRCWNETPEERPKFSEICQIIADYLASISGYLDMDEVNICDVEVKGHDD